MLSAPPMRSVSDNVGNSVRDRFDKVPLFPVLLQRLEQVERLHVICTNVRNSFDKVPLFSVLLVTVDKVIEAVLKK